MCTNGKFQVLHLDCMVTPERTCDKQQFSQIWVNNAHAVKGGHVPKDTIHIGRAAKNGPQRLAAEVVT